MLESISQWFLIGFMDVLLSGIAYAVAEALTKNKWVRRLVPIITFIGLGLLYLKFNSVL